MRLLLDTHVLVWLVEGNHDLQSASRSMIEQAGALHGLMVSSASVYEIARLVEKSKIALSRPLHDWFDALFANPAVGELPVSRVIAQDAAALPDYPYGDPFDRLLIATARREECRLATHDRRILEYGRRGNVYVMPV